MQTNYNTKIPSGSRLEQISLPERKENTGDISHDIVTKESHLRQNHEDTNLPLLKKSQHGEPVPRNNCSVSTKSYLYKKATFSIFVFRRNIH